MASKKKKVRSYQRPDNWALIIVAIGTAILMSSLFVPRWRVDVQGTGALSETWKLTTIMSSWSQRTYGLLHVQASYRQSWSTLTTSTCQWRNYVGTSSIIKSGWTIITSGGKEQCTGSKQCSGGFFAHMSIRCEEYEKVWRVSSFTLATSLIGVFVNVIGVLFSIITKRRQYGGLAVLAFFLSGASALIMNIVWASVSDSSFKTIMRTAWFPYPSLGIGWFLHFYGSLTVLTGCGVYGAIILPETYIYDRVEEKIARKDRKINQLNVLAKREEQAAQDQQQMRQAEQDQQQMQQMQQMQQIQQMQQQQQMQQMQQQQLQQQQQQQMNQVHLNQIQLTGLGFNPQANQPWTGSDAFGLGADLQMVNLQVEPQKYGSPTPQNFGQPAPPQSNGQKHFEMPLPPLAR